MREARCFCVALCGLALVLATSPAGAQEEFISDAEFVQACCPACQSGFIAGAELAFLKPHFKDNIAYVFQDVNFVSTFQTFDYGYETSPRLWLGYRSCCGLGLLVRYFEFHQNAQRSDIVPPGAVQAGFSPVIDPEFNFDFIAFAAGDAVDASHSLELRTVDLEASQSGIVGAWSLLGSFGIRYATIDQDYRMTRNPGNDVLLSESRFEGVGPTVSLHAGRPLWRGLAVFSSVRGSILFGDEDSMTFVSGVASTVRDADEQLSIGEIQLGLEWSAKMNVADPFVRASWEGQVWNGARSLTGTDEYMALMGFGVTIGLTR